MSLIFRVFGAGRGLVLFCAVTLFLRASVLPHQEPGGKNVTQPAIPTPSRSAIDFEVKVTPKQGVVVRRKGTQEWTPSSKLSEPTVVGLLDGERPIYVVTKAIKPPKAKHIAGPHYPAEEEHSGHQGEVSLHIVVDEQGTVRLPTVDASPGPGFAKSALEAVKKWTFEPGKINGQPVAVLIKVEVAFRSF